MKTLRLEYDSGLTRTISNVIGWSIGYGNSVLVVTTDNGTKCYVLANLREWSYTDGN